MKKLLTVLAGLWFLSNALVWAETMTQVITFDLARLSFEKVGDYDLAIYEGYTHLAETGNPQLLMRIVNIAIPAKAHVTAVAVASIEQDALPGTFLIFPAQEPRPLNQGITMDDLVKPNLLVYNSNQSFPEKVVEFVRQADLAGQELALVRICPLQYIPAQKKLIFNTRIEFTIYYTLDGPPPQPLSQRMSETSKGLYDAMLKGMVLNPEALKIEPVTLDDSVGYAIGVPETVYLATHYLPDHVIITNSALQACFTDLVTWHKKKGVPDTVITTEYIYDHYTGSDEQEKIRNFIIYAHAHWGASYFLLGGDINIIPVPTKFFALTYEYVPSDMYYSDFDDDWVCEVFIGRASVENPSEVAVFVDKVLTYEKDPPFANYGTKVLLMGFDANPITHCGLMKRRIANYYIPNYFDVATVYDWQLGNHRTACLNYLNAGQNLVNHADHGYYDGMGTGWLWHQWALYNSDVENLTNGDRQSIVYSLACDVNGFDYYSDDCFAEHFVHNPSGGGVAFIGNTRYGFYQGGNPYTLSAFYDMEWWCSLFDYNIYHLGQTLADSKNRNLPGGDAYLEYIVWELSLLGEPEMPIWTSDPTSLDVAHTAVINTGYQNFTVTVTFCGNPHPGATVCVWKGAEVYAFGLTNSNGQKTFSINPQTPGTLAVTVTAQNHHPYEGICAVNAP